MYLTLFLYLFIFFVEYFLGFLLKKELNKSSKKNNFTEFVLLFLIILIPAIIAGIRDGVGTDYFLYEISYKENIIRSIFNFHRYGGISLEIGFYFLCKIANFIFNDYHGLLFISAFVIYYLSIMSIKSYHNKMNISFSIFIYMILYFAPSLNIIRQIIASSIIFYSFRFIERKDFFRYLLMILLAIMFHTSSIFCFTFYFLNFKSKKFSKFKQFLIILIAIIFPIFFSYIFDFLGKISFFAKYTSIYSDIITFKKNFGNILIRLPITFMIIIHWNRLIKIDNNNRFYLLLYIIELSSIVLGFYMHWAFRVMYYCMFSEIILIPQIIKLYSGKKRMIIYLYFFIYYLFYFIKVHFRWENDGIFPFKHI